MYYKTHISTFSSGIGVTFSVIRENDNGEFHEIRPIEKNLNYDSNFQQYNHLTEEITVLPVSCHCVGIEKTSCKGRHYTIHNTIDNRN